MRRCEKCKHKTEYNHICDMCDDKDMYEQKTMNNLERIKNMTVEEMAEILFSSCTEKIGENANCYDSTGNSCKKCTLDWLNKESEDN